MSFHTSMTNSTVIGCNGTDRSTSDQALGAIVVRTESMAVSSENKQDDK